MVALANPLVQLRSSGSGSQGPVIHCLAFSTDSWLTSQAEGIAGQQTEMGGMTASGMAKIAGRVEDSDSEFSSSNVP